MRKVLAFTLAALLFAGPIFVAAPAALAADLGVTQYESSRTYYGSAGEDGMFTLTLSGVNNADGLTVSTGSGSAFILADGMQQFPTFVGGNKIMVPLVYIGSGQNLVIVISRGDDTHEQTLYIKEAIPVAQPTEIPWDPPEEPDYGAEQPRFDISGVLPQLKAGQSNEIKFSLSNNSSYAATNVVVALVDNGEKRLFKPATVSGNSVAVGNMNTGNTKDIAIPVTINADVEQGYYTVGLLITMYNRGRVKVTQTDLSVQVYIANDALSGGAALMTASAAIDSMTPDASGKLNLSVSVTNSGNGTATNTKVTLSGFKATGLLLDETLPTKDAGTLTVGRTVNLSYALRVTPEFVPGIQELTATVIYTDSGGTAKREDITLYLSVNKRPQDQTTDAVVQMSSMKQSTTNPGSSNTITLSLGFTNIGALAATNATLAIDGLSSSSFSLMGSFGDVKVGTIEPGQTASLDIPLYVSEGLSAGNYPTDTILTFTDASGASRTVETTIYIYITRPGGGKDGESDTSVPRVIINQHSFSVASVTAGTPFTLNFSLLNTSKNKDLKNMKVTVQNSGDAGVFLPVAGVNSFYVEALARGEATELSIELIPRQDAESKSFPVSIGIEYEEDNEGNKTHAVTETLSIPVYQPQRFEVSNQYFNPDGMGNAMLTFQFVNKGKSSLYNLTIKIEGPMSFMEGEYFFGTLQPGMMEYFEDTVIPQVTGDISGELVVMYEDSAGALLEYREPLQTFIDGSMPVGPDFPGPGVDPFDPTYPGIDEPLPEEGGGKILGMAPWLFWTLLGVVVLIIVIVIIVVVRKKKAKKALMDDDE